MFEGWINTVWSGLEFWTQSYKQLWIKWLSLASQWIQTYVHCGWLSVQNWIGCAVSYGFPTFLSHSVSAVFGACHRALSQLLSFHTLKLMAITLHKHQWLEENNTRSIDEGKWPCAAHCDSRQWWVVPTASILCCPVPLAPLPTWIMAPLWVIMCFLASV